MEPKGAHPFDPEGKHPLNPANWKGALADCPVCKGSGKAVDRDAFGAFLTDCPSCAGSAKVRDLSSSAKAAG